MPTDGGVQSMWQNITAALSSIVESHADRMEDDCHGQCWMAQFLWKEGVRAGKI